MSLLQEHLIEITTDASGDSTDTTAKSVFGLLYAVYVNQGTLSDAAADLTFSYTNSEGDSVTLLTITDLSADNTYYPRELEDDNAGSALTTYALPVVAGTIKVVTAQGGNAKSGSVLLYVLEK